MFPNAVVKKIKPLILSSLYKARCFDLLRYSQKNRVIILMYHRFSDEPEPFKIQQNIFENQIKFFKKKYNFISLKHYSEVLNEKRDDIPNNPIIITMDDGYQDNYTVAYPILKKYSIPATIFITTDFINNRSWLWFNKLKYILQNTHYNEFEFRLGAQTRKFHIDSFNNERETKLTIFNYCKTICADEIHVLLNQLSEKLNVHTPEQTAGDFQPLTWEQIKEMQEGQIEFGSHTCSHPILSRMKYEELKKEIILSKKEISRKIGSEVNSFCYPVGTPEDISDDVIKTTKEAGYSCAVTTIPGSNAGRSANRFLLKRIAIATDSKVKLSKNLTLT